MRPVDSSTAFPDHLLQPNMTEHSQLGKSTGCDEKRVLRRSHSNVEIADINKVKQVTIHRPIYFVFLWDDNDVLKDAMLLCRTLICR